MDTSGQDPTSGTSEVTEQPCYLVATGAHNHRTLGGGAGGSHTLGHSLHNSLGRHGNRASHQMGEDVGPDSKRNPKKDSGPALQYHSSSASASVWTSLDYSGPVWTVLD